MLASLADAAELLAGPGPPRNRVLLIGGGARSAAVRQLAPGIFGNRVAVPEPEEYVALGAARQAAWALAGTAAPPDWPRPPDAGCPGEAGSGGPGPEIRARHAALRAATATWDHAAWKERNCP